MISNTRLLAIALMLAGSVAGCDGNKPEEVVQALNVLAGRVDALEAKPVAPDYTTGSPVVAALIEAEDTHPTDAAGEPVALMAVAEPEPVAHKICDPDWDWRGVMQLGACHLEYW